MAHDRARDAAPLLALGLVVVATTCGSAQGWAVGNVHNGLLALSCAGVGAYVLFQRPGHRVGWLLVAAGLVEAAMFLGRQVALLGGADVSPWWAWTGTWPVPLALGVLTLAVVCFPDGRPPSSWWTPVVVGIVAVSGATTMLSALWPVGYAAAGVGAPHPFVDEAPAAAETAWHVLAQPSFVVLQLLWVVALVQRARRRQDRWPLAWLLAATTLSGVALVVGLVVAGSPTAGLLSVALVPVAAGIAVVHAQHATAYAVLSWPSRGGDVQELPGRLVTTVARVLGADRVVLWTGPPERLVGVAVSPEGGDGLVATTLDLLRERVPDVREIRRDGSVVGALAVERRDPWSRAERRLLDDLAAQGALVLGQVGMREVIAERRRAGGLDGLTSREQEVLALIGRGLSNAAIGARLSLSVKTVEPLVGSVFAKLGLPSDSASNRRVLAALEHARAAGEARYEAGPSTSPRTGSGTSGGCTT